MKRNRNERNGQAKDPKSVEDEEAETREDFAEEDEDDDDDDDDDEEGEGEDDDEEEGEEDDRGRPEEFWEQADQKLGVYQTPTARAYRNMRKDEDLKKCIFFSMKRKTLRVFEYGHERAVEKWRTIEMDDLDPFRSEHHREFMDEVGYFSSVLKPKQCNVLILHYKRMQPQKQDDEDDLMEDTEGDVKHFLNPLRSILDMEKHENDEEGVFEGPFAHFNKFKKELLDSDEEASQKQVNDLSNLLKRVLTETEKSLSGVNLNRLLFDRRSIQSQPDFSDKQDMYAEMFEKDPTQVRKTGEDKPWRIPDIVDHSNMTSIVSPFEFMLNIMSCERGSLLVNPRIESCYIIAEQEHGYGDFEKCGIMIMSQGTVFVVVQGPSLMMDPRDENTTLKEAINTMETLQEQKTFVESFAKNTDLNVVFGTVTSGHTVTTRQGIARRNNDLLQKILKQIGGPQQFFVVKARLIVCEPSPEQLNHVKRIGYIQNKYSIHFAEDILAIIEIMIVEVKTYCALELKHPKDLKYYELQNLKKQIMKCVSTSQIEYLNGIGPLIRLFSISDGVFNHMNLFSVFHTFLKQYVAKRKYFKIEDVKLRLKMLSIIMDKKLFSNVLVHTQEIGAFLKDVILENLTAYINDGTVHNLVRQGIELIPLDKEFKKKSMELSLIDRANTFIFQTLKKFCNSFHVQIENYKNFLEVFKGNEYGMQLFEKIQDLLVLHKVLYFNPAKPIPQTSTNRLKIQQIGKLTKKGKLNSAFEIEYPPVGIVQLIARMGWKW